MRAFSYLWTHADEALRLTLAHLELVALATLLAFVTAVPLGAWIARHPRWAGPTLAVAGGIMAVPSIAMLGLMVPLLAGIGQGIGRVPAVIALTLYAQLPILRNTYTGLREANPEAVEAAIALGMTETQVLWRVRLPLATPTIMAGVRTAGVITVGTATLAAFIGAGGLGEPIIAGVQLVDTTRILSGAIPAALLALLVDSGLGFLERSLEPAGLKQPA